ncbi:MAG: BatD family protein [Bacteroidota bacterium]
MLLIFGAGMSMAQTVAFEVKVSSDSILMGNYFEVTFSLENTKGRQFTPPSFEGFSIVGGPSQSSMTSVINGKSTQSLSYTYYLEPIDIGNYYIEPASIETEEGILESSPVEIIVLPNPDGIQQTPAPSRSRSFEFFTWPQPDLRPQPPAQEKEEKKKKYRKKRKTYRI